MATVSQCLRVVPAAEFAAAVADEITGIVRRKPTAVLGLPTGNTPLPVYRELVARQQAGLVDLSRVTVVQLDEYRGARPEDPVSFAAWLRTHLLDACHIGPEQFQRLPASAGDVEQACRSFEAELAARGGCDLQVLGLGLNGHIGFNDPGSSRSSRTRLVTLTEETRAVNADYWSGREVPAEALTQGVATLLEARQLLLLVNGAGKAGILQQALEGPITSTIPASFLRESGHLQVFCDVPAASRLRNIG